MNKIRIAMCQILCLDGDRNGNIARMEVAADRARDMPVDIVCFPEPCVSFIWMHQAAESC